MTTDYKNELNPQQLEAVTFTGTPLLLLAGAGSGKTRVLTYRAAYLIDSSKASADNVLLLTFTNKAAAEMQERLVALVGHRLPFAGTFHSFCAKLLRRDGAPVGVSPSYIIYDDSDQLELVKQIHKRLDLPSQFQPRGLLSKIGWAKQELISPIHFMEQASGDFAVAAAKVYKQYQQTLDRNQALDFDDLILKVIKLLSDKPNYLERYQRQFSQVLIDEYQDTNKAQYLLAKLLASGHRQLTVVGDASQSIYRWRGADFRNLEYLKTDFPELTTLKLEQNYRSTKPILDVAYAVIKNNESHPILSLWTQQEEGELISLFEAEDEKQEAQYILKTIKQTPDNSSAVLYRTNAQSRALEEACLATGTAYILVGGTKFYDRKEVKDVLAYLRLLLNPSDPVSLRRAEKLGKRRLASFMKAAQTWAVASTTSVELIDLTLSTSDYLSRFDIHVEADLARLENIQELKTVASEHEDLVDFLESVSLVEKLTLAESKLEATTGSPLTLMTIHAAKGLEFDQVFVVGLEEGIFPHSRSLLDKSELEEERRLCYVAITRARKKLHLTYARNRVYFGGSRFGVASRFIGEVPHHLLDLTFAPASYTTTSNTKQSYISDEDLDKFLDGQLDVDQLLNS